MDTVECVWMAVFDQKFEATTPTHIPYLCGHPCAIPYLHMKDTVKQSQWRKNTFEKDLRQETREDYHLHCSLGESQENVFSRKWIKTMR